MHMAQDLQELFRRGVLNHLLAKAYHCWSLAVRRKHKLTARTCWSVSDSCHHLRKRVSLRSFSGRGCTAPVEKT